MRQKKILLLSVVAIGVLVGCGAQPTSVFAPIQAASQALAQTAEQFASLCQQASGSLISISGVTVCRKDFGLTWVVSSVPLVQLTPSQPQGGMQIGVSQVRKNDTVTIRSQGYYGSNCFLECSGTIYSMDGMSYLANDANRTPRGIATINGAPAGLMISDGTAASFAGNGVKVRIANDGMLRFGINSATGAAPQSTPFLTPLVTGVKIDRCFDINNQTYVCP